LPAPKTFAIEAGDASPLMYCLTALSLAS
jgi:hypothetical protein